MNIKQFEISTRSRYSWTNMHDNSYVICRKCSGPLLPSEFATAVTDYGKIIPERLPERCTDCENRKRMKKEEKAKESKQEKVSK